MSKNLEEIKKLINSHLIDPNIAFLHDTSLEVLKYLMELSRTDIRLDPAVGGNIAILNSYKDIKKVRLLLTSPRVDPNRIISSVIRKDKYIPILDEIFKDKRITKQGILDALKYEKITEKAENIVMRKLYELGVTKKELKITKNETTQKKSRKFIEKVINNFKSL